MSVFLIFFKASHFMMDNVSINGTIMQEIAILFNECKIDFDATD